MACWAQLFPPVRAPRRQEQAWPEEAPFHTPVFVVTHEKRDPWQRPGGTTGVELLAIAELVAQARTHHESIPRVDAQVRAAEQRVHVGAQEQPVVQAVLATLGDWSNMRRPAERVESCRPSRHSGRCRRSAPQNRQASEIRSVAVASRLMITDLWSIFSHKSEIIIVLGTYRLGVLYGTLVRAISGGEQPFEEGAVAAQTLAKVLRRDVLPARPARLELVAFGGEHSRQALHEIRHQRVRVLHRRSRLVHEIRLDLLPARDHALQLLALEQLGARLAVHGVLAEAPRLRRFSATGRRLHVPSRCFGTRVLALHLRLRFGTVVLAARRLIVGTTILAARRLIVGTAPRLIFRAKILTGPRPAFDVAVRRAGRRDLVGSQPGVVRRLLVGHRAPR